MTAFLLNKYAAWYMSITSRAKDRTLPPGYTESHHIIPISLGGSNSAENRCRLTAKEHFVCHLLLTKMTEGKAKAKCVYALSMMLKVAPSQIRYTTTNSRTIASMREQMAIVSSTTHKGKTISADQRQRQAAAMTGRVLTEEHKENISKAQIGKPCSEHRKQRISESKRNKPITAAHKAAMHRPDNSGAKNPRAIKVRLQSPTGEVYETHGNFAEFCESHALTFSTMCNLLRGHRPTRGKCVGWTILP